MRKSKPVKTNPTYRIVPRGDQFAVYDKHSKFRVICALPPRPNPISTSTSRGSAAPFPRSSMPPSKPPSAKPDPDLLSEAQAALAAADTAQAQPYTTSAEHPSRRALILAAMAVAVELRQMRADIKRLTTAVEEAADA